MGLERGYIQIYTGNGKGKTTAALGLVLRAVGAGLRVYIAQFLKGQDYSELHSIRERFSDLVKIEQFGTPRFVRAGKIGEEDIAKAKEALSKIREAVFSGMYDIVVIDEGNVAVYLGLIDKNDIIEIMEKKPENVELIITGRYAPDEFIERADLVTEMLEVKHYYKKGVQARTGIEK